MEKIKVSVIVPVFNMEKYLAQTLESLKKQSLKALEVIVVDDTSTDSTPAIIDRYCKTCPGFTSITLPRLGLAASRNAGLKAAKGKYVTFLDGDDLYTPGFLKNMAETADKYRAQMTVGKMRSFDIFGIYNYDSAGKLSLTKLADRYDTNLIWNPSLSNKLFLRERVEELSLSLPDCGLASEAVFSLSFALKAQTIACGTRGFTQNRVRGLDKSFKNNADDLGDYLEGYRLVLEAAQESFRTEKEKAISEFETGELEQQEKSYYSEITMKELTVILYRYYRRFHRLSDEDIRKVCEAVGALTETLAKSALDRLLKTHSDIFRDGRLIASREEMNARPLACFALSGNASAERLEEQVEAIFNQYMPAFEVIADSALKENFPERWKNYGNVKFIDAPSGEDFRQSALEATRAEYILFYDAYSLPDAKVLQRHYNALESNPGCGFTTSPVSCFDGKRNQEYKSSTLSFYANPDARRTDDSPAFVLDLYFCNKLFRVSHLKGIKFAFTDNAVIDMYKIYTLSSFRKLPHAGVYLKMTADELLAHLKEQQSLLPGECASFYRHWRLIYFRKVTLRRRANAVITGLKGFKRFLLESANLFLQGVFRRLPLKNRVFFYTVRDNGRLSDNSKSVFDALDAKKTVFARVLPHKVIWKPKVYYHLLTSKVIVTDDYIRYLRAARLREGQKVVQLWHACGAFKRFGIDAPSRLTHFEELRTHSQYSAVTVSSENCRQYYAHAFGVKPEIILPLGVPRTDALIDEESRARLKESVLKKHPLLRGKRIILFCPTFRESKGQIVRYDPKLDWLKLDASLNADEVFIINTHPISREVYLSSRFIKKVRDYSSEPTPELLACADVIVTDYSSIIFETILIGKPVFFYCPDYESYERDFYLNYPDDLPGPVVTTQDELLETARAVMDNPPTEKIDAFRREWLEACDGKATQRVVELIKGYLS